ncbi:Uncharacterised protein [Listeria ivanovii subsp. londoniensis]|uniref:Uncharacterized protein n=1 Tax=Listeria ivanovii TaxID=1638 RepID=A0AAX2DT82_LISIV|nr:hypothetical protein [Listeria ivanovii]EFR97184.1 gp52 [Listeria ivanovii FSL F6-596]SDX37207.1 hypothetical protein SAMN05421782_1196 [Listeria ivanovii]VEH45965.1 Uncharacterised protein [Listeria ivanovii subsp. londoniensis]
MTSTIKISKKDKVFQLAYKNGWVGLRGTKITIQGIDFAFCPLNENGEAIITISEVSSGALMLAIPAPNLNTHILNTREKVIDFYENDLVPLVEAKIKENGIEKLQEEAEKVKKYMIKKFGDMPDIADVEVAE